MDYTNLIKKLILPNNISAPTNLAHEDITARPLSRADLHADMYAVNSSLDIIRSTRGGSWSVDVVSEDFDSLDLAWHEREFRDGNSFAYVVYDINHTYIGCFYLYGIGVRTALNDENINYEVDASWWVTKDAYKNGYYKKLKQALDIWLIENFHFRNILYSNIKQP